MNRLQRHRGFSLVELMVALVVAALLGAIAYPSYSAQVRKARRAECRGALLQSMLQQERLYTQQGLYAAFEAGSATAPVLARSGSTLETSACLIEAAECEKGSAPARPSLAQCIELRGRLRDDAAVPMLYITSGNVRGCTRTSGVRVVHPDCWT